MSYSLVSHVSAGSSTGNNVTTGAINTTGATLIVIAVAFVGTITVSDSASNTWTALAIQNGTQAQSQLFYAKAPTTSASHTFTVTSTGAFPALAVEAWSGAIANPFDQQNGSANASAATSAQPGSVTPSQNGELIIASVAPGGAISALAIDSSFTISEQVAFNSGANFPVAIAHLVQGTAAAVNPTWSWTTSETQDNTIATFEAAPQVPYTPVRQSGPILAQ